MTFPTVPPAIEPAELTWHDGLPESTQLGTNYFSHRNELEELLYVLSEHGDLPTRFAAVPHGGSFVVAQTGFGTGLNFLATWQAWQNHGPSHAATLHFVCAEPCPFTPQDLKKALLAWPELRDFSDELIANYPPLIRGTHRLLLDGGRMRLTLFFGDVQVALDALCFQADAWFLSECASAENPEAWLETTIAKVGKHSKPGTTLATPFAGERAWRLLNDAGFRTQTSNGFMGKRDLLSGVFQPDKVSLTTANEARLPTPSVAVIGAGIAGCSLANNLARRGYAVTLIDSADEAGSAASGNVQGALYVKLGVEFNHQTELALSALTFSQRYYAPYRDQYWHPTGLLQLAWNASEQDRHRRFIARNQYPEDVLRAVTQPEAERLTGAGLESGGLWFPGSGWLKPGELCKSLALHPGILRVYGFSVSQITADDGSWLVSGTDPSVAGIRADQVVICAGHLSPQLIPGSGKYRFKAIRGQVTHVPESLIVNPQAVICGARYFNPACDNAGERSAVIGATFDLHSDEPDTTVESHRENIRELSAMVPQLLDPQLAIGNLPEQFAGRVGFRCTTHDYQPVAGLMRDAEGQELTGLYLLTGLGSKGLTYAPLLAEFVADQISGQPTALPGSLAKRLATRRMHRPPIAAS